MSVRQMDVVLDENATITGTVVLDDSSAGTAIVYVGFRSSLLAGPKFIRIPSGRSSGTLTLYVNPAVAAPASVSITASTSTPQPATFFAQTLSRTCRRSWSCRPARRARRSP